MNAKTMVSLLSLMALTPSAWATEPATIQIGSNDLIVGQPMPSDQVYNGFGCTGKNVSPELHWNWGNAPAPDAVKSYAVTVYDAGAPTDPAASSGGGFWHWVVIDIPSSVTSLAHGKNGSEGEIFPNDFGPKSYSGPCPPPGATDHYRFTVYALNVEKLESLDPTDLTSDATSAVVRFFLTAGNVILSQASFTIDYAR